MWTTTLPRSILYWRDQDCRERKKPIWPPGTCDHSWRGRLPLVDGVWRRCSVRRLGRAGRRVSGGLGSDLKLVASPCLSSFVSWFAGFLRTSCSAGWRSNGDASSGSGETLDRWCRSRCWRRLRRRSPSGGRHRDPLLAFHPMVPGESLKSLDWAATVRRHRFLLEDAALGVQDGQGLRAVVVCLFF